VERRYEVAGLSFAFGGQHYGEVFIALRGLRFGGKCKVNFGDGYMRSVQ